MLTTAETLNYKENEMIKKNQYLNMNLENNLIDYAYPSRILINKYLNVPYWPEYKFSNKNNKQEKYKIENMTCKYSIYLIKLNVVATYLN